MSGDDGLAVSLLILRAATQVMEEMDLGLATRGFDDVRPMHGFAFVLLAAGPTTVAELAVYLGVTKQAASQLVEQLVQRGYVTREKIPGIGARGYSGSRTADGRVPGRPRKLQPRSPTSGGVCSALKLSRLYDDTWRRLSPPAGCDQPGRAA